jgi:hypothetical protein
MGESVLYSVFLSMVIVKGRTDVEEYSFLGNL